MDFFQGAITDKNRIKSIALPQNWGIFLYKTKNYVRFLVTLVMMTFLGQKSTVNYIMCEIIIGISIK